MTYWNKIQKRQKKKFDAITCILVSYNSTQYPNKIVVLKCAFSRFGFILKYMYTRVCGGCKGGGYEGFFFLLIVDS